MDISFKFDPEILIGTDTLSLAGTVAGRYGKKIMIAADKGMDAQTVGRLKDILQDSYIEAIVFNGIEEDSSVEMAGNIVDLSCAAHCDAIIGFGGRKTQIIARMAAIMAPQKISIFELLDRPIPEKKFLPFISIPTEGLDAFSLTTYFLAADPRNRLIKSIPSPDKLHAAIIIDSSLIKFLAPASFFLLDGYLSAIEAYCSARANFLSDALLERALNFYTRLFKSGAEGMSVDIYAQASFLTALGSSVSSPGVGAALAYAVSGRSLASKPQCSAAFLPLVAEKLISARPEKMARVSSFLGSSGKAASVADAANTALDGIRRCMETLKTPADLKEFNIPLDKITAAVSAACALDFVADSPWTVTEEAVFDIIRKEI